jgi:hypothetical protein
MIAIGPPRRPTTPSEPCRGAAWHLVRGAACESTRAAASEALIVRRGRRAAAIVLVALAAGCAAPMMTTTPATSRTAPAPVPADPVGINTAANPSLQAAVLRAIGRNEGARSGGIAPRLLAAGPIGRKGTTVTERWIVDSNGNRVTYNVDFVPTATTGTAISIERLTK